MTATGAAVGRGRGLRMVGTPLQGFAHPTGGRRNECAPPPGD